MIQQPTLKIPFNRIGPQGQEIKIVGIFENLASQIGLGFWKCLIKVRESLAIAMNGLGFNLVDQHISGPAVLDGCSDVPRSFNYGFDMVQNPYILSPG